MLIRETSPFTLQDRVKQVGGWGYRWYKVARDAYRQRGRLVSLEQAFNGVEKLHHTAPQVIPTPELKGVPFLAEAAPHKRRGRYATPEDYVTVLHDVLYCPRTNLLLTDDRKIISDSLSTVMLDVWPLLDAEVEYLPGCYTPFRSLHNVHYHLLVDNLPRLLALDRPPFSEMDEIRALCPGEPNAVEAYLFSKVAPNNARLFSVGKEHLYRLETVLFTPFKTRWNAPYLPETYTQRFREKVLPTRPSKRSHRAFISRENAPSSWRIVKNREELMAALERRGFEKILAEEFSPEEEVEYFYDAEVIAGAHGSGLTNMIFSKNLKVVELTPFWFVSPNYYYLSKALGHMHGIWSGTGNRWMELSFTVSIPGVLRLLDRMDIR